MAPVTMRSILVGLVCLATFGESMPQTKNLRKFHILGRPGDSRELVIRDRTVIPSVPVIDVEEENNVHPVINVNVAPQQLVARKRTSEEEAELFKKQAESAKYSFDSSIDDGINGLSHTRTETRESGKVVGMYSYSDGFVKRTVSYEADDKGYRITKEESEPIGDGPEVNLDGEAIVNSSLGAAYKITIDDIQKLHKVDEPEN